jgi:hypothetical protein
MGGRVAAQEEEGGDGLRLGPFGFEESRQNGGLQVFCSPPPPVWIAGSLGLAVACSRPLPLTSLPLSSTVTTSTLIFTHPPSPTSIHPSLSVPSNVPLPTLAKAGVPQRSYTPSRDTFRDIWDRRKGS